MQSSLHYSARADLAVRSTIANFEKNVRGNKKAEHTLDLEIGCQRRTYAPLA